MIPKVPDGLTVEYHHKRAYGMTNNKMDSAVVMLAKGGSTTATIKDADGVPLAAGEAYCSPHDNYNKRIGRAIALGRALKDLEARGAR